MMDLLQLQADPQAFRDVLLIDTDSGPKPFRECADDWQRSDFLALDDGWRRAVLGSGVEAQYSRGWLERARGHSKSLDLGIMASWALFASRRRLSGIAAAGDLDQARLLRDAIGKLVYVNPWLSAILEIQNYRVVNKRTESTLDVISSDAKTAFGLTPDFLILDEVTNWVKPDLWESLISSAAKRSTCMVVCIQNAGLTDDWQWKIRESIREDDTWYFSRLEGCVASWISQELLAEQERLLPDIAFRRLWHNEWSTGGSDALREDDIDAAIIPNLHPQTAAQQGWDYTMGVDLGVSRDASAVVVLGVRRDAMGHGRIRLAHTRIWHPTKSKKVDLLEVEDTIRKLHNAFALKQISFDPWEARHLMSSLQAGGLGRMGAGAGYNRKDKQQLPLVEVPPAGKNLQAIATALLECFADRRIELFNDFDLVRDLKRLRVEERSYGFRLTSPRDALGHGDMVTAFGLALLAASEQAAKKIIRAGVIGSKPEGKSDLSNAVADMERRQNAINEARSHGDASGGRENYLAALKDIHRTDPFFRQFR